MAIKQPEDHSHFILPDLGEGVHEAELIRWRVKPGDEIAEHQTLAEMETDKALVEVPSPWSGVIKTLNGNEGDIINVGSVLVEYEIAGNAAPRSTSDAKAQTNDVAVTADADGDAGTVVGSVDSSLTVSDTFTRRRPEVEQTTATSKALATPAVRRIAREAGIDINRVPGTGRGGRVTASDVQAFGGGAAAIATPVAPVPTMPAPPVELAPDGIARRIPFRGVRRKIAASLDRSIKTAVHFTVVDEADVTALEAKRQEYMRVIGRKISLLPFVMTAVCRALREHPELNANVDDENAEILERSAINLGCAVDTDHGLMVPVVPNADTLSSATR
jgi:pyruvate dehydrogenase E2 component (dihydrolipoamide acetyltransferase)